MSPPPKSFSGFTLLEIMISLTILAVGILAVFSSLTPLSSIRRGTSEMVRANMMLNALCERIQGAAWSDLATSKLSWSRPRFEDPVTGDADPLTDADLLDMGIIRQPLELPGLKVYVEYYRAIAMRDASGAVDGARPGLMDDKEIKTTGKARALLATVKDRDRLRIIPDAASAALNNASLVGQDDPVLIRLLMTWDGNGRRELITGRKR